MQEHKFDQPMWAAFDSQPQIDHMVTDSKTDCDTYLLHIAAHSLLSSSSSSAAWAPPYSSKQLSNVEDQSDGPPECSGVELPWMN